MRCNQLWTNHTKLRPYCYCINADWAVEAEKYLNLFRWSHWPDSCYIFTDVGNKDEEKALTAITTQHTHTQTLTHSHTHTARPFFVSHPWPFWPSSPRWSIRSWRPACLSSSTQSWLVQHSNRAPGFLRPPFLCEAFTTLSLNRPGYCSKGPLYLPMGAMHRVTKSVHFSRLYSWWCQVDVVYAHVRF